MSSIAASTSIVNGTSAAAAGRLPPELRGEMRAFVRAALDEALAPLIKAQRDLEQRLERDAAEREQLRRDWVRALASATPPAAPPAPAPLRREDERAPGPGGSASTDSASVPPIFVDAATPTAIRVVPSASPAVAPLAPTPPAAPLPAAAPAATPGAATPGAATPGAAAAAAFPTASPFTAGPAASAATAGTEGGWQPAPRASGPMDIVPSASISRHDAALDDLPLIINGARRRTILGWTIGLIVALGIAAIVAGALMSQLRPH